MERDISEILTLVITIVAILAFLVFAPSLVRVMVIGGFSKIPLAIGALETKLRGMIP